MNVSSHLVLFLVREPSHTLGDASPAYLHREKLIQKSFSPFTLKLVHLLITDLSCLVLFRRLVNIVVSPLVSHLLCCLCGYAFFFLRVP